MNSLPLRILSVLLCVVFLHAQTFALSGGPDFGSSGINVIGTYAGVLLPESIEDRTTENEDNLANNDFDGDGDGDDTDADDDNDGLDDGADTDDDNDGIPDITDPDDDNDGTDDEDEDDVSGEDTGEDNDDDEDVQQNEDDDDEEDEDNDGADSTSTSIGLFSVGVDDTGPAIGATVVFVEGTAFNGNISGIADPLGGRFRGIVDAVSTYLVVVPGIEGGSSIFAQGSIDAVIFNLGGANTFGGTTQTGVGGTRLVGTASIDIFGSLEADGTPDVTTTASYTVDGFKQSDQSTTVTFGLNDLDFGGN